MNSNNHIEVTEVIRIMDAGATQPVLCRCNDGNLYVIKSTASASRKELVHEFVAASLAKYICLSIPDFAIIYIPNEIVDYLPPQLKGRLSQGYAFASYYIRDSANISFDMAHQAIDLQSQKKIYLFDRVINNSDRTLSDMGGNVNIIYNVKEQRYYLIDHNLAFDPNCQDADFNYHVYSPRHRSWEYDMVDATSNEDLLNSVNSVCPGIVAGLPDEWLGDDQTKQHVIDNILSILARGRNDSFRRAII
ncbi:TPA: HipA family kinase [Morganella morganii]